MNDETQMPIFGEACLASGKKEVVWKLFIDGAARNNPGSAGAGICLLKDDVIVAQEGFFLGLRTNNQAEYLALLLGIFWLKKYVQQGKSIRIVSDSQLLVRQMIGQYRVKNSDLQLLQHVAFKLLEGYEYRFCHVLREQNKMADMFANLGIDKKIVPPDDFIRLLRSYEIRF